MATELKGELRRVPLKDLIVSGPTRTDVKPSDIAELSESLKRDDLIEPIVVSPRGDKYALVAGDKRQQAAKLAGWKDIPAIVRETTDAELLRLRWEENAQRSDWNALDKARLVKEIVELRRKDDPKVTLDTIGAELGMKQTALSHYLLLLEQPKEVQDLVKLGRLTPTHVVKPINRLAIELREKGVDEKAAKALVVRFADQVAHGRRYKGEPSEAEALDVDTSEQMVPEFVRDYQAETKKAEIGALMDKGKAKVRKCPFDRYAPADPEKGYEAEGRLVLVHRSRDEDEDHRWFADTGEQYLTAAEKKGLERQKAKEAKDRKEAVKQRRKVTKEKVERDYAVWFSRAPLDAWAQALLDAAKGELAEATVDLERHGRGGVTYHGGGNLTFGIARRLETFGDRFVLDAVDVDDGKGGKFHARVQIGDYRSGNEIDNVAEGANAKKVRQERDRLLEFQRKKVGVKQADEDLWPVKAGGFELGEKVRIGSGAAWSSYVGKQGTILAFDVMREDTYGNRKVEDEVSAVLDFASAHKLHRAKVLEKLTKFGCAKCGGKARIVEGKRICDTCAKAEGSCDCPPKTEKGAPKKKARGK